MCDVSADSCLISPTHPPSPPVEKCHPSRGSKHGGGQLGRFSETLIGDEVSQIQPIFDPTLFITVFIIVYHKTLDFEGCGTSGFEEPGPVF